MKCLHYCWDKVLPDSSCLADLIPSGDLARVWWGGDSQVRPVVVLDDEVFTAQTKQYHDAAASRNGGVSWRSRCFLSVTEMRRPCRCPTMARVTGGPQVRLHKRREDCEAGEERSEYIVRLLAWAAMARGGCQAALAQEKWRLAVASAPGRWMQFGRESPRTKWKGGGGQRAQTEQDRQLVDVRYVVAENFGDGKMRSAKAACSSSCVLRRCSRLGRNAIGLWQHVIWTFRL